MADEEESLKPTWEGDFVEGLPNGMVSAQSARATEAEAEAVTPPSFLTAAASHSRRPSRSDSQRTRFARNSSLSSRERKPEFTVRFGNCRA